MEEQMYEVWIDNKRIASHMIIDDALILVKGLYQHYYLETDMQITIKPMTHSEVKGNSNDD